MYREACWVISGRTCRRKRLWSSSRHIHTIYPKLLKEATINEGQGVAYRWTLELGTFLFQGRVISAYVVYLQQMFCFIWFIVPIVNCTLLWVYWDQIDANCLVLNFFITLFALHVSDVIHIHPQERYIMYMQMVQVSARVSWPVPRRVWNPDTSWKRSTYTCTYLYHLHVHYISLLRLDVYYIRNM